MSRRLPCPRSVRAALLLSVALTAACVDDTATLAVDRAPGDSATTTTRLQLSPADGSLRVRVDGVGETDDDLDHVLLVGDSVLVLVADDLGNELDATLHVDATDCRRLDRGFTGPCGAVPPGVEVASGIDAFADAVERLAAEGIIPDAAVLILANNAAIDAAQLDAAMAGAGQIAHVWWVTARVADHGYQDPNNGALAALAGRDPRVEVVDWFDHSEGRTDWLADIVHPNEAGQRALAELIAEHLRCGCTP